MMRGSISTPLDNEKRVVRLGACGRPRLRARRAVGAGRVANDGGERHGEERCGGLAPGSRGPHHDSADHSRPQPSVGIRNRHFDVEDTALGIGGRRNARDAPLEARAGDGFHHQIDLLAGHHRPDHRVWDAETSLDGADVAQNETECSRADEGTDLDASFQQHSGRRRHQRCVAHRGHRQLRVRARSREPGLPGVERRLCRVEVGLDQAFGGKQRLRPLEIQSGFFEPDLRLDDPCPAAVDLLPVLGVPDSSQHRALLHEISRLDRTQPAIGGASTKEIVHVSRGLEGQWHLLGRLDGGGVADVAWCCRDRE
jgi:hypothetical protein